MEEKSICSIQDIRAKWMGFGKIISTKSSFKIYDYIKNIKSDIMINTYN